MNDNIPPLDPVVADEPQVVQSIEEQPLIIDDTPTPVVDVVEELQMDDPVVDIEEAIETKPEVKVDRKAHKALQEYSINHATKMEEGDILILPAQYDQETKEVLENLPNVNLLDSIDSRKWADGIREGMGYSTSHDTFVPTLEDPEAEFRQRMEHNGTSLMGQAPRFKTPENQTLKGERGLIRIISHLGLGTLFQAPMWHSGIWLTFKPPTESELTELNRVMLSDKIKFGRYSYGLSYSNITAYTVDRLVDFAIGHVYDITAKSEDINIDNLRDHISCQDIHSLLWGFVCTMYPKGFRYERSCVADPEKCNYVLQETLNVTKLQWTNTNSLTDWQKTHMSGRQAKSKDIVTIKRYKEELSKIQKKKIEINKDQDNAISITIKTPSVADYVNAGHRWIGDIVATVERALGTDASDNERNAVIIQHGQASSMRQYSHWIESIEYDTNIIDDQETIEQILGVLSSDDSIRTQFIEAVVDYINKSTISVIGIPVFDCPSCGKVQESQLTLPQYKNIIPLDVIQVFLGLLMQRIDRVVTR